MAAAAGPGRAPPPSEQLRGGADCCAGEFPASKAPTIPAKSFCSCQSRWWSSSESEAIHCAGAVADHLHAKGLRHRHGCPRPGSWWAPGGASRRSAPAWPQALRRPRRRLLELEEVLLGNARRRDLGLVQLVAQHERERADAAGQVQLLGVRQDSSSVTALTTLGLVSSRPDSCAMASTSTFSSTVMLTGTAAHP